MNKNKFVEGTNFYHYNWAGKKKRSVKYIIKRDLDEIVVKKLGINKYYVAAVTGYIIDIMIRELIKNKSVNTRNLFNFKSKVIEHNIKKNERINKIAKREINQFLYNLVIAKKSKNFIKMINNTDFDANLFN